MLPFIEALLSFTQINAIKEKSECLGFGSFSSLPCDHHHQLCIIFCVFWTAGVVAQLLSILLQVGDHLNWSQLPQMGAHTETLESYLDAAVEAAKRAGQIILSNFYVTKAVEHKGKVDLVTETDKACETMIFQYLESAFPSHQFIGEETSATNGTPELTDAPTWIVDPLDGTTNFVHRYPFVCVSIGLVIDKVPTIGVVFNPILDEVSDFRSIVQSMVGV
jgi:hypothetical protein